MQGSYKTNGLPRPYYMKPNSKRTSAYDKLPQKFFHTNSRKLTGYLFMVIMFGLIMYMISQDLKSPSETVYELETPNDHVDSNNGDVGKLVDSAKVEDQANEKLELAKNEQTNMVVEAPKGGSVNEGPIVGNDQGLVVDGRSSQNKNPLKNLVQASRNGEKGTIQNSIHKNDLSKLSEVSENAQKSENSNNLGGQYDSTQSSIPRDSVIKKKVYHED